jgi:hypothetical protein
MGFRELPGWRTQLHTARAVHVYPNSVREERLCSGSSVIHPMDVYIWLYLCVLYLIFYNKLVNVE